MLCPLCKVEMRVESHTAVVGDDSPLTETQVMLVQEFFCRNPQCERYGGGCVDRVTHPAPLIRL